MAQLRIHLLGAPRCESEGRAVEFTRRKTLALLAYLAVTSQPHDRDALATLFWPEYDQASARANLRRTLSQLKETLSDERLDISRMQIALDPHADIWLDVAEFQSLLAAVDAHRHAPTELCADCLDALTAAAELYPHHFMAGFNLPDCPEFDEWQFFLSESLRQSLGRVLQTLVEWHIAHEEYERGIEYARRQVALDSWHEPAHAQLMQLYAMAGQPSAALRQYETLVRVLDDELGVAPTTETTALYNAIKSRRSLPSLAAPANAGEPGALRASTQTDTAAKRANSPRHNLPAEMTPFIGRRKELFEIAHLLLDGAEQHLISLVGPGGIGKTRLAIQTGREVVGQFRDGVCFAPLAGLASSDYLVPMLAEKLELRFYPGKDARQQLLDFLQSKQMLLILDNFEHLLNGVDLIREILQAAPGIRILVTSRERLNISSELIYAIGGMEFPQHDAIESLLDYDAAELLVQSARLTYPGFEVEDSNIGDIIRICQLVEGMPLALVLAAGWLGVLSLPEIAQEITASLDFLETELRDVPERQRSVRAAFEYSWKRLSADDQQVFMKLCVFRGGFTRHAAEAVAGAGLPVLRNLINRSFVSAAGDGRYAIHELLRQYGLLYAQQNLADYEQTCLNHSAYYIAFLRERAVVIKEHRQRLALADIAADIDNVRVAWEHTVARHDWDALDPVVECYWLFSEFRGALSAGEAAFRHALATLLESGATADADPPADYAGLAGFLMAAAGCLRARQGRFEDGVADMHKGIAWIRRTAKPDRRKEAFALAWLAFVLVVRGHYDEARTYAEESLSWFPETGDRWLKAGCLRLIGASELFKGQLDNAEHALRSCLAVCQEIGERRIWTYATTNLGLIAMLRGAYSEAGRLLDEALETSYVLDDLLSRAEVLREKVRLALALGDYAQAEECIEQHIAIYQKVRRSDTGAVLRLLGDIRRAQGDYISAEQLYRESLEQSRTVDHQPEIARCLSHWGMLEYAREAYAPAEAHLCRALAIWERTGNEIEIASVELWLGHVLAALGGGRWAEAAQHLAEALELAIRHRLAPVALDVFVASAELLHGSEWAEKAIALLSLAADHPASAVETRQRARLLLGELVPADAAPASPPSLPDWTHAAARLAGVFSHDAG